MVKIRKFDEKDFLKILKIEKECFDKDAYAKEDFNRFLGQGDLLVAEEEGKIFGYVLYSWQGEIFSIAVKPEFQNQGIGSALLSKALENLKCKANVSWLQTRKSNSKAQKFFESFGFKPIKKLEKYYKDEDGILMIKKL